MKRLEITGGIILLSLLLVVFLIFEGTTAGEEYITILCIVNRCYTYFMFYVYLLECADGTFYVGSTNDLAKRLYAHNHLKSGAHYTKIRRPVVLRHSEKVKTYAKARAREGALKRLTRKEKAALALASKRAVV
jgi:putative endonuclease